MSVTAGVIIIAVIPIRFLLRRAPKIFSYALWLAVLFRLLCPVTFSSDFCVLSFFQPPVTDQGQIVYFSENVFSSGASETPEGFFAESPNDDIKTWQKTDSSLSVRSSGFLFTGACVWLSGFFIMAAYSLLSYRKVARVPVLSVNESKIEIELSLQETQLFLSEQKNGVTYKVLSR